MWATMWMVVILLLWVPLQCIGSAGCPAMPLVATSVDRDFSLGVMTWNLAERSPSQQDCEFLKDLMECDIVVLGIQECEDIRPRRTEGRRSRKWRALHKGVFLKKFECIATHKLGGIQSVVYASKNASRLIKDVQAIEVPCGVGNVLHNKGGVAFLLRLKSKQTLALINAHLAAQQHQVVARNADYWRIGSVVRSLAHRSWLRHAPGSPTKLAGGPRRWIKNLDSVVFFGDLNYRLDLPRLEIELHCDDQCQPTECGKLQMPPLAALSLLEWDQLNAERKRRGAFAGFSEPPISFPPTFKYDVGSGSFDSSSKQRIPAYTDRVLYCCQPDGVELKARAYYSLDVRSSDHRPVCAIFDCKLRQLKS